MTWNSIKRHWCGLVGHRYRTLDEYGNNNFRVCSRCGHEGWVVTTS